MSKYEYPKLPRREIAQFASVSEADLMNPNSDFICNLYTRILIHIGCLPEDAGLLQFEDLEILDNPDSHIDSVRIMNLCKKMKDVLAVLECPKKFNLKDLLKPEADRTEWFLSAIINFSIHREMAMKLLEPVMQEVSELVEQEKEVDDRLLQLEKYISEFNESREKEMPFVQEIDIKIKELRQTISALNNHQMSLKAAIRKKKDAAKDMDEKISSAEFALVQSAHENANLRSKVVQSPDKLQRELEEKKADLVQSKNAERAAIQAFHEKSAILEVYTKASKKMSKHLKQMQALQEQVNDAKQVEKDVKDLKDKINHDELVDKKLEAEIFVLQGRADQLEELLKQLEKERNLTCEEASKELNNVRSQVEYNRRGLEQRQGNVEALVAEAAAINEQIKIDEDHGAAKKQILLRKCEEISREFFKYTNSSGQLLSGIEAWAKAEANGIAIRKIIKLFIGVGCRNGPCGLHSVYGQNDSKLHTSRTKITLNEDQGLKEQLGTSRKGHFGNSVLFILTKLQEQTREESKVEQM